PLALQPVLERSQRDRTGGRRMPAAADRTRRPASMRTLILACTTLLLSGCATLLPTSNLVQLQNEADQAYASGQFERASARYRRLAAAMPSDAGVRYQLGNSLARQGDIRGAVDSFRETLVRDPQHARA